MEKRQMNSSGCASLQRDNTNLKGRIALSMVYDDSMVLQGNRKLQMVPAGIPFPGLLLNGILLEQRKEVKKDHAYLLHLFRMSQLIFQLKCNCQIHKRWQMVRSNKHFTADPICGISDCTRLIQYLFMVHLVLHSQVSEKA